MFNKTFVNSVGLFLDIVGSCLIYRFGYTTKWAGYTKVSSDVQR